MINRHVGGHLADLRLRKGETADSLGKLLGVSPDLIQAWENGSEAMWPDRLIELSVYLDCKIMDFFVRSPVLKDSPERRVMHNTHVSSRAIRFLG